MSTRDDAKRADDAQFNAMILRQLDPVDPVDTFVQNVLARVSRAVEEGDEDNSLVADLEREKLMLREALAGAAPVR